MTNVAETILDLFKQLMLIGASLYGYRIFSDYMDRRKERKTKRTTDYSSDYDKKSKIRPILDELLYELEADRIQYWEFSNGEKTLSGHHLKKLSLFMESNADGFKDIAATFQLVPVKQFERNLDNLYESSTDYIISNETREFDELASLFAQFGIGTILSVKVKNEIGVWVGILSICYKDEHIMNEGQIALAKLNAAKLSIIK